mmetsp:Transcript_3348/g.9356  ORF Transcript_3348/g.9356 Transcript_3348/m.9356 type:complete len:215 (+) Transcript_3348:3919-4563(+)
MGEESLPQRMPGPGSQKGVSYHVVLVVHEDGVDFRLQTNHAPRFLESLRQAIQGLERLHVHVSVVPAMQVKHEVPEDVRLLGGHLHLAVEGIVFGVVIFDQPVTLLVRPDLDLPVRVQVLPLHLDLPKELGHVLVKELGRFPREVELSGNVLERPVPPSPPRGGRFLLVEPILRRELLVAKRLVELRKFRQRKTGPIGQKLFAAGKLDVLAQKV